MTHATFGYTLNAINFQTCEYLQRTNYSWHCLKCLAEIIAFSIISNEEYFELKQGKKKLKFKALAIRQPDQTTEMIDKINDAIDNPENENSNWEVLSSGKTSICHI